jgi:glycosyltransferase involved in cell wall biosynthesis
MRKRLAFVYLDFLPNHTGSGAHLRFYSNAQALLDIGFELEFVEISEEPTKHALPEVFSGCRVRHFPVADDDPGPMGRLAFRLGQPTRASMRYAFPYHRRMLGVAYELMVRHPEALHFIEGEHLASTLPFLPSGRVVWSCHDLLSPVRASIARASSALEGRPLSTPEKREIRFAIKAERRMAQAAPLILTISDADRKTIEKWGCRRVETLPMSVPGADESRAGIRSRRDDGRLSVLHLGATSHLPSYDSLCFLLGEVLPILADSVRDGLHIRIAGRGDKADPRSRRIRELAARFPRQVEMLGFVEDLEPLFLGSDLQVVATTEKTGLRTRIVESFARGLPVAGTTAAAAGLLGIRSGENIMLADSAPEFATMLASLVHQPARLHEIAATARRTYDILYARDAVATTLAKALDRHFDFDMRAAVMA